MSKAYIFYNPLAGNGRCKEDVSMLECILPDEIVYCDMTKSETYERDLFSLEPGDYFVSDHRELAVQGYLRIGYYRNRKQCMRNTAAAAFQP